MFCHTDQRHCIRFTSIYPHFQSGLLLLGQLLGYLPEYIPLKLEVLNLVGPEGSATTLRAKHITIKRIAFRVVGSL